MSKYLYEWVQNLAYYMIAIHMLMHVLPDNGYKKYVRFFVGLMLTALLADPVFQVLQVKEHFWQYYYESNVEQNRKDMEDAAGYLGIITEDDQ